MELMGPYFQCLIKMWWTNEVPLVQCSSEARIIDRNRLLIMGFLLVISVSSRKDGVSLCCFELQT